MSDFAQVNATLNEFPTPTSGVFINSSLAELRFSYRSELLGKTDSCTCIAQICGGVHDHVLVHADSEALVAYNSTGKRRAVMRSVAAAASMPVDTPKIGDPGSVNYLEIFEDGRLVRSKLLNKETGGFQKFPTITSGLVFSPGDRFIAWIASTEKKNERRQLAEMPKVRVFDYKDYGEDLNKVYGTVLVVYDTVDDKVRVIGAPDGYGACQFSFASQNVVVLQAVDRKMERLLGLRSYENRPFHLFAVKLDEEKPAFKVLVDDKVYLTPRAVQVDEKTARVFYGRFVDGFGGHSGPAHLGCITLNLETLEVVEKRESEASESFASVPHRAFLDKDTVVVSLERRCQLLPVAIDLNTFEIRELMKDDLASVIVDDVRDGKVLVRVATSNVTPRFAVLSEDKVEFLTDGKKFGDYQVEIVRQENMNDAILILAPGDKKKFIVSGHGGPSGMFSTFWSRIYAVFFLSGYSVCLVNYRGSTGYPADVQKMLPGKVGELDVGDVVEHIDNLRKRFSVEKLGIFGWSHGGLLACGVAGQHSDKIDFAVAGAPVTNMISGYYCVDIPDWPLVESGVKIPADGEIEMDEDTLLKMWKSSMVRFAKNVTVPMLLIHGHNDRRVTWEQSLDFYLALKRNGKKAKLLLYEGIGHSWTPSDICYDIEVSSVRFFNDPLKFIDEDICVDAKSE